jgi:uroporphyrinogen decarboxylase
MRGGEDTAMPDKFFSKTVQPDTEGLLACLRREGTPRRVFAAELMLDPEVQTALVSRFGLDAGISASDPYAKEKKHSRLMQFLGYESVRVKPEGIEFPNATKSASDTAGLSRAGGRKYMDEARGPVTTWEEFEHYPWPDPKRISTKSLEWYEKNLPDGMCMATGGMAHFCEYLVRLMGYETLCYALVESRDLVKAIRDKLVAFYREALALILTFPRVRMVWGGDDMGFRTATLLSPADLRELVFPGHAMLARMAHEAGRPYILHSCGNLSEVMEDLITDVGIDAKHSFEDAIQTMQEARRQYGRRIGLIGGIDVDFLCRATEEQVRARTRSTIEDCVQGGGWCLGTGNSVANYIPLDNYLAMLDEGRRVKL